MDQIVTSYLKYLKDNISDCKNDPFIDKIHRLLTWTNNDPQKILISGIGWKDDDTFIVQKEALARTFGIKKDTLVSHFRMNNFRRITIETKGVTIWSHPKLTKGGLKSENVETTAARDCFDLVLDNLFVPVYNNKEIKSKCIELVNMIFPKEEYLPKNEFIEKFLLMLLPPYIDERSIIEMLNNLITEDNATKDDLISIYLHFGPAESIFVKMKMYFSFWNKNDNVTILRGNVFNIKINDIDFKLFNHPSISYGSHYIFNVQGYCYNQWENAISKIEDLPLSSLYKYEITTLCQEFWK